MQQQGHVSPCAHAQRHRLGLSRSKASSCALCLLKKQGSSSVFFLRDQLQERPTCQGVWLQSCGRHHFRGTFYFITPTVSCCQHDKKRMLCCNTNCTHVKFLSVILWDTLLPWVCTILPTHPGKVTFPFSSCTVMCCTVHKSRPTHSKCFRLPPVVNSIHNLVIQEDRIKPSQNADKQIATRMICSYIKELINSGSTLHANIP